MIGFSESGQGEGDSQKLAREMKTFFSASGALSGSPDFEYRPEQQEMAVCVAEALEGRRPLVIEAGTGVGKSLAYLIPAVEYALAHGKKAIISTHTINLQEQLVQKDIPIVSTALGKEFNYVLYKGRGNYLCPMRLKAAMRQTRDLFSGGEEAQLQEIQKWSLKTKDGSLSDLPFTPYPSVWAQVRSEPFLCSRRRCRGAHCFYQDLRRRVDEAHLVVMNHTLFFSVMASLEEMPDEESEGFLFPNDFVIFDEAHTLENVAARQLGLNLSQTGAAFDLHRLFHPKKGR
ncbi:MAG: ATP-dependent DNA helicase, partial [Verrucomicrobiota bacterium]